MLVTEMIRVGAQRYGSRIAISSDKGSLTFTEVDTLSSRIANTLLARGVKTHERIGILLGNSIYTVPFDFACLKARLVRVPLNPRLSVIEHGRMLASAGVRRVVFDPTLSERASNLESELDGVEFISLGPNGLGKEDLLELARDASPVPSKLETHPDDPILALFTSGTTGTLKAAVHTQRSYSAIVTNILANLVSPGKDDVMIHSAPLIHASGTFVMPFWLRGARAHVLTSFDPATYLKVCQDQAVTHANLVPTMIQMLLGSHDPRKFQLALKSLIYGASPMPSATIAQAIETFGLIFTQYYGQTEAPLAITTLSPDEHRPELGLISSAGMQSVDARLSILNKDNDEVEIGEIGEVVVDAPFVMAGYLDAPALNSETFVSPRRIRTRDLGYRDDRGYLYLVDRSGDMIISGGYNVYPREVEDVLQAHPFVTGCGVVGTPDPMWVERVVAFVSIAAGSAVSADELIAWCRNRLAGYKVPKEIRFVDSIPLSAVGKVLRRSLRDQLGAL